MHMAAVVDARKAPVHGEAGVGRRAGARAVMQTPSARPSLGLSIMTGTASSGRDLRGWRTWSASAAARRRHSIPPREFATRVRWWYRTLQPDWSDMEYMIRLGQLGLALRRHHRRQHIHISTRCCGCWGRRRSGDGHGGARPPAHGAISTTSSASINEYADGVHMHSTIRQLNGCANERPGSNRRTKGSANLDGVIPGSQRAADVEVRRPDQRSARRGATWTGSPRSARNSRSTRRRKPPLATLMAFMGRDSAYSGKAIHVGDLLGPPRGSARPEYLARSVRAEAGSAGAGRRSGTAADDDRVSVASLGAQGHTDPTRSGTRSGEIADAEGGGDPNQARRRRCVATRLESV